MNFEVWYSTVKSESSAHYEKLSNRHSTKRGMLCFTHAVQAAVKGEQVRQHVVSSDNYYTCDRC